MLHLPVKHRELRYRFILLTKTREISRLDLLTSYNYESCITSVDSDVVIHVQFIY